MRKVINISLTKELNKAVDSLVKKGKYSTKSEFLRELIREKLVEESLLVSLKESQREIAEGKGKVLRSLKDLR